ncbi:serine hydrolase [Virgibacillus alimentarius]|uniref:CubicO group peptidase (Beta-lactamase class C family) n=1 Tax=Virgibacillus alimentarius TaxID=698769 RepID=A0ABS4SB09_9BACI|nr:serine hydrolase [Virgibacillus alimentarius]MBP2258688.1 CubicO group peptidase (beta-lactamase class C family) [Virgibacillus alimentarius]
MRIASGSKSLTAFAVLRLVAEGKIQLDDQVVKYLLAFLVEKVSN